MTSLGGDYTVELCARGLLGPIYSNCTQFHSYSEHCNCTVRVNSCILFVSAWLLEILCKKTEADS